MNCPKCKSEIVIDPAGAGLWHCSPCQMSWRTDTVEAYWQGRTDCLKSLGLLITKDMEDE